MREAATLVGVALVWIAGGCGDEDGNGTSDGDCRDAEQSCFAPFVCREADGAYGCRSPEGDVPGCHGTPAGQEVPLALADGSDLPVHWPLLPGCIPVTHTPDLAGLATDIAAAVEAWDAIDCSALCFEAPASDATAPAPLRGERRLHFETADLLAPTYAQTVVLYEITTGRVMSALIDIDPDEATRPSLADLVTLVGQALGLARPPEGTDSAMAFGSDRESPSVLDEDAICAVYGSPSYCGD